MLASVAMNSGGLV